MSESVIYKIVRYDGYEDYAEQLRDGSNTEVACADADVIALISSTPALREIRDLQEARISCLPDIVGQLPFVLVPVVDGDDTKNFAAKVNGIPWRAYRTDDEGFVVLTGWSPDDGPDISPYWAEFRVGEGEINPLIGWTSIGLVFPGVAVEYACYDHRGWGTASAVETRPFDNFVTVFIDWLLSIEVLRGIWGGDSSPYSPGIKLFEAAANAADHKGSWSTEVVDDELDEGEGEVDDEVDNSGWMNLELHLPDVFIEEVRWRLSESEKRRS